MDLDLDRETLLEGIARGTQRALTEAGTVSRFHELLTLLEGLHLLKEGLLTADQCCALMQVSRRTFDRWVAEGKFRKETAMGYSEPRFWITDILELLQSKHLKAATDPTTAGAPSLRLIDLAGSVAIGERKPSRRQKKAA